MHSETSKTIAVIIGLMISAIIPAAALTMKNTSDREQTVAVDTGSAEKVYKVPAGSSVVASEDCSNGCAVTGPWGYSKTAASNAEEITTNGKSEVTAHAEAHAAASPIAPAAAPAAKAAPEAAPAKATMIASADTGKDKAKAKVAKAKSKPMKSAGAKAKAKTHHAAKGKSHPMPGSVAALFGNPAIPF